MHVILDLNRSAEELAEQCHMIGICPAGAMACPFKETMHCEKICSCRQVTKSMWEDFFDKVGNPSTFIECADSIISAWGNVSNDPQERTELRLAVLALDAAQEHLQRALEASK